MIMWFAENLGVSNEKMCKYKRVHDNIIIYYYYILI